MFSTELHQQTFSPRHVGGHLEFLPCRMHWDVLLVTMQTRDKHLVVGALEYLTTLCGSNGNSDRLYDWDRLRQEATSRFGAMRDALDMRPANSAVPQTLFPALSNPLADTSGVCSVKHQLCFTYLCQPTCVRFYILNN